MHVTQYPDMLVHVTHLTTLANEYKHVPVSPAQAYDIAVLFLHESIGQRSGWLGWTYQCGEAGYGLGMTGYDRE
jgi:hypothetical protein